MYDIKYLKVCQVHEIDIIGDRRVIGIRESYILTSFIWAVSIVVVHGIRIAKTPVRFRHSPQMVKKYSVSVIVPVRNEAGTIKDVVKRVPRMGKWTEVIFVEGFSKDNTWEEIEKQLRTKNKRLIIRGYRQKTKRGKAGAVEIGFSKARGQILMILDGDLSTPPIYLPDFYSLLASGKAQFGNGSRFVYSKEKGAMRYFNHLGNKFFAFVFSVLLHQKITDTLCGTKVIWSKDYKKIRNITKDIRGNDPYGDFTLLIGAGRLGLKISEIPIKYKARVYGKSNISPFWDGLKLILLLVKSSLVF